MVKGAKTESLNIKKPPQNNAKKEEKKKEEVAQTPLKKGKKNGLKL